MLKRANTQRMITFVSLFFVSFFIVVLWLVLERAQWSEYVKAIVPELNLFYLILNYMALALQLFIALIFMDVLIELL